jgi:hypothetical protein
MQSTHASASKERMLRYPKQIWIAEAMLQLCYHKGASMAGSKTVCLRTPKDCRQVKNACFGI